MLNPYDRSLFEMVIIHSDSVSSGLEINMQTNQETSRMHQYSRFHYKQIESMADSQETSDGLSIRKAETYLGDSPA